MQSTQLEQLLKFLTDTLQQGKDFTVDQAPQFVKELLLWQFWSAAIWMGVAVVIALAIGTFGAAFFAELNDEAESKRLAKLLVRLLACGIAIAGISANAFTMVQVKVAPRVVLVEKVRDLIAGSSR